MDEHNEGIVDCSTLGSVTLCKQAWVCVVQVLPCMAMRPLLELVWRTLLQLGDVQSYSSQAKCGIHITRRMIQGADAI